MSWRDGFTEPMFNRLQHIIDVAHTRLHSKKSAKKYINIDEVYFCRLTARQNLSVFLHIGVSYSPVYS